MKRKIKIGAALLVLFSICYLQYTNIENGGMNELLNENIEALAYNKENVACYGYGELDCQGLKVMEIFPLGKGNDPVPY